MSRKRFVYITIYDSIDAVAVSLNVHPLKTIAMDLLSVCPRRISYAAGRIPKITDFPYLVGNATKTSFPFMKASTASHCFVFRGWTFSETATASIESSSAMYAEHFTLTSLNGY